MSLSAASCTAFSSGFLPTFSLTLAYRLILKNSAFDHLSAISITKDSKIQIRVYIYFNRTQNMWRGCYNA